jgi:hypothetical protein
MNQHRRDNDKWWLDKAFVTISGLITLACVLVNYRLIKIENHSEKIPVIASEVKHNTSDIKENAATIAEVKKKQDKLIMEVNNIILTLGTN